MQRPKSVDSGDLFELAITHCFFFGLRIRFNFQDRQKITRKDRSVQIAMPKYVAFLRAINVGGHTVKMDHLRTLFEELGFANVETLIASGNVIFDARQTKTVQLEGKIEKHLHEKLGYPVTTFIRSTTELAIISRYKPFAESELTDKRNVLFIAFLNTSPSKEAKANLLKLRDRFADFHTNGRELYWLRRRLAEAPPLASVPLEKVLGLQMTFRNANTIMRIVSKYP